MRRKLVPSRSAARAAIDAGTVEVGGLAATKPASLVDESASIRLRARVARYVGRGGLKLEAALTASGIDVAARRAVDVGASTGGFTDCLLQHGASEVVAVDVGYGQLDWTLRTDDRVVVVERANIRHADPGELGAPFDVVVADLSFISLRTVAHVLFALGGDECDYVVLIKPQFEVGKDGVGKGGIVREPHLHAAAVEGVAAAFDEAGIGVVGVVASPVTGAKGNREFLAWAGKGRRTLEYGEIEEVTAQ